MEVLLNAAWLMLTLVAGWIWLRRWRDIRRYSFPVQLCSLTCALIILFPVVSANDDLYLQCTPVEAPEKHKTSPAGASKSGRPSFRPQGSWALPPSFPPARLETVLAIAETGLRRVLVATFISKPLLNRPPPFSF